MQRFVNARVTFLVRVKSARVTGSTVEGLDFSNTTNASWSPSVARYKAAVRYAARQ